VVPVEIDVAELVARALVLTDFVIVLDPIVVAVLKTGDAVETVETVIELVATLGSSLPIRPPASSLNQTSLASVVAHMSHGEEPTTRTYSTKRLEPGMNFPILLVACSVNHTLL
jgi:hypothetical protein